MLSHFDAAYDADTIYNKYFMQLAARIAVSNLHKNTLKSFKET